MLKRHKDLLRYVVTELRHTLAGCTAPDGTAQRGDLDRELERLGITPAGHIMPRDVLPNPTSAESWARRAAEAELAPVPQGQRARAREQIVERVAYSWINRLVALRALEARGLPQGRGRHRSGPGHSPRPGVGVLRGAVARSGGARVRHA